jgi:hypothetical protein
MLFVEPLAKELFTLRYLGQASILRANGFLHELHDVFPFVVRYRTTNGKSPARGSVVKD